MVSAFDAERALDCTVSVAEGPAVVIPSGVVVAGNGRVIAQQRLYEARPEGGAELKTALQERAVDFGLDPAQVAGMEKPVLVRRIVDPEVDVTNVDQLRELNASSDQPVGKTKDPLSEAATKAVQFREAQGALEHFASTADPDATIRSYLGGKAGRDFLGALVEDGVITGGERARFVDSTTGVATEEGRTLVEPRSAIRTWSRELRPPSSTSWTPPCRRSSARTGSATAGRSGRLSPSRSISWPQRAPATWASTTWSLRLTSSELLPASRSGGAINAGEAKPKPANCRIWTERGERVSSKLEPTTKVSAIAGPAGYRRAGN